MTPTMWLASLAWISLVLGATQRFNRNRHVPLVLFAMTVDLALVAYLQITRNALETALGFSLSTLQQLHIGFSSLALVLYVPVIYLGFRILMGDERPDTRLRHRQVAYAALTCRTIGFFLMFSMWKG